MKNIFLQSKRPLSFEELPIFLNGFLTKTDENGLVWEAKNRVRTKTTIKDHLLTVWDIDPEYGDKCEMTQVLNLLKQAVGALSISKIDPDKCYDADSSPIRCYNCASTELKEEIVDTIEYTVLEKNCICLDCGKLVGVWNTGYWDPGFKQGLV